MDCEAGQGVRFMDRAQQKAQKSNHSMEKALPVLQVPIQQAVWPLAYSRRGS